MFFNSQFVQVYECVEDVMLFHIFSSPFIIIIFLNFFFFLSWIYFYFCLCLNQTYLLNIQYTCASKVTPSKCHFDVVEDTPVDGIIDAMDVLFHRRHLHLPPLSLSLPLFDVYKWFRPCLLGP